MRFLDLALAGLIGVSSVISIGVLNPQANDLEASRASQLLSLRDSIFSMIEREGLVALRLLSQPELCSLILSQSNSSVKFSVSVGGMPCEATPPSGVLVANVTLPLPSRELVIEAWPGAQA